MATLNQYKDYVNRAGFSIISTSIMNSNYIEYTNENIETIKSQKEKFIELFDKETYEYSLNSWTLQKEIFEESEVLITLLKIKKPQF